MQIHVVTGTHFSNPSEIRRYFTEKADADAAASVLVNKLRREIDLDGLPPIEPDQWAVGLAEAQRAYLERIGAQSNDGESGSLAERAGFDVHIEEAELNGISSLAVDDRELGTIFAALRGHQQRVCAPDLLDVATNGGKHSPMTPQEIDMLCQRLFCDTSILATARIVVALDGGLVQGVVSDRPIQLFVVDYDVAGADQSELSLIPQDGQPAVPAAVNSWALNCICMDPDWINAVERAVE
jgi:hypothetical protein